MSQGQSVWQENDDKYATLLNNAQAVRALCSAVEGTLGPKGLDVMLVGQQGEVIITNDGVTILEMMDVSHPIAKLVIQVARAQQHEVGDGTTTATVLAGALVQAGVDQVTRGVPAAKVVAGIQLGADFASEELRKRAVQLDGWDDPLLQRAVHIAGREQTDIVSLVLEAGKSVGWERLRDPRFRLAETVVAHEKASNEWFNGMLLKQKPLQREWLAERENCRVLVLRDSLEPEALDEQLLTTEAGFQQYMHLRANFMEQLERLHELDVGFIVLERGIHPEAEQFCLDHDMMVLQRVSRDDVQRVARLTGAKPLKRAALGKDAASLAGMLGCTARACYDERLERVRLYAPDAEVATPAARDKLVTLVVGASTREVVGERARIAADAAAALQAAIQGGILPGGGAAELAVAYALERYRETVRGMEAFGIAAVAEALRKPMAQIVLNAGFNPLEKLEEARAAQAHEATDTIGIDCDTGAVLDVFDAGVVDPAAVKLHALKAASEVAAAVLRIHTVIKMRVDAG
ncbi:TCP-1/cpn60 chaperonin family protein [Paenibacillus sp. UMB4589-SE434]|uniref:TCP-1/cpn60 chaperonin family protein n=1 Tax=Paenibacillus sp. UMB4589-SE434 TaxID=3046314 RepID=UPI00254E5F5D|nr:TCP-1/cpn60 chaperonin family protein [Paenibacillus sp. UMB4589-SE434]MDK8181020.1 TCP-1/cpn60 chaperonin family protein [Paenibacillus sp. UMB4589-SE434]